MLQLDRYLKEIDAANSLDDKKIALVEMIDASHAKAETKRKALIIANALTNPTKVLQYAYNYALSGEGNSVI
jgi:hypothetical protein|tara:strand:- start:6195 stop:6410 length:216 start_codon:yes stop_codon:yes gene_type:complete